MAGRRHVVGGVGPRGPPGPLIGGGGLIRGPGWNAPNNMPILGPGPGMLEQKHADIQRLVGENQRLAATHVALRQELAASQGELQRMQQMLGAMQTEKDNTIRGLLDKIAKMEAEFRSVEPLRAELQALRLDLQNVHARRQELEQARVSGNQQLQALTQELQKARTELQQIPALRQEAEGLRQEAQLARQALEYEKKNTADQVDQRQAMQNNLVSMARDVEKLRAELTNLRGTRPTNQAAGGYTNLYPTPPVEQHPAGQGLQRPAYNNSSKTGFGMPAIGVPLTGMENGMQYMSQMGQSPGAAFSRKY
eukprot:TRINITY_DN4879_c0_g5_i3.p1 TRINITY_DN4879_c0_g5~~TRINITY_DN4879_c0_g5_i3.p1  ORF type:complete len:308 (-),score=84.34 TRINITY_DN4879_c0_g5_i3:407-1330(-)